MSQIMKNVKALSIPVNGVDTAVKKIEDANGNIIWGSESAFPYRRLEYIHLNGAEKVLTDFYAGTRPINHQCEFTVEDTPTGSNARTLIGIYDSTNGDALARWYPIWRGPNGIRASIGNQWTDYATNFSLNDKLKLSFTYTISSSNKPAIYWYLNNQSTGGGNIGTAAPLLGTVTGEFNTTDTLVLGCQLDPNITTKYYNYWKGKLYNYQRRQTNGSGTLLTNFIPCQRKSDGVCGMYDTINSTFSQMTGTTITDAAAGPVVDEYWDLTA